MYQGPVHRELYIQHFVTGAASQQPPRLGEGFVNRVFATGFAPGSAFFGGSGGGGDQNLLYLLLK